jgi:transcriptional regulator with XRE-family HTH domain
MPASSSNPEAGKRLRAARERLGLKIREVERMSRLLAEKKQNQEYYISHAWLSEIERGELTPGIYKIYTLSTIYQYRFDEVLDFFGIQIGDIGREQIRQPLPHTHLVGSRDMPVEIPSAAMPGIPLERTDLVSRMFSGLGRIEAGLFPQRPAVASVYGYVGTKDFTLFPLIRPGSFVEIDSSQRRIENTRWGSVFERPIYFVELRDDYACSWCEEKEGSLLLIPFPQSGCRVREVRYPAEAGVIGRVTAVLMRIAESREKRAGTTLRS